MVKLIALRQQNRAQGARHFGRSRHRVTLGVLGAELPPAGRRPPMQPSLSSRTSPHHRLSAGRFQVPTGTADQVLAEMSQTTGLPIKAPLAKAMVGRPEIQKYLTQKLHAEYTLEEMHAQEASLQSLRTRRPVNSIWRNSSSSSTPSRPPASMTRAPRPCTSANWVDADMQSRGAGARVDPRPPGPELRPRQVPARGPRQ